MTLSQNAIAIGILVVSTIIVLSYLTDIFAATWKIPSVLVLLSMGMLLRPILQLFDVPLPSVDAALPFLGTLGLVLIVLEAALHLNLDPQSAPVIRRASIAAAAVLVISAGVGTLFLHWATASDWHSSLVNAVPFAIISSAMAIPTAQLLDPDRRQFVVYESTFSDIIGILFFTAVSTESGSVSEWLVNLTGSILLTIILSVLLAIGLVWLVTRLRHHVKFFLVLFLLLMAYSIAKLFHLPALLAVFLFGLAMNNAQLLLFLKFLSSRIDLRRVKMELRYTRLASGEMAFLVRTIFFVLFGYSLLWDMLLQWKVLQIGFGLLLIIYLVRWLYFRLVDRRSLFPEVWLGPRGLISVLLFYSIPPEMAISEVSSGVVFMVVVVSALFMAGGIRKVSPQARNG